MTLLILGAGMAGLSAARLLADAGLSPILLEARDRIGGRTYTSREFCDLPVEFGAELIHGEKAATWELVRQLGLHTLHWRKTDDSMVRLANGDWLTMQAARESYPDFDLTRSWALPPQPVAGGDESFGSYLTRLGFTEAQMQYVRRAFANAAGDNVEVLSAATTLEELAFTADGEGDFRIVEGYAALLEHLAAGLDIRLNCAVQALRWGADGVQVNCTDGEQFHAEAALVTLPLGVLQSGTVRFSPSLPPEKQQALQLLRMGPALKMIYRFAEPITPPGITAIYSAGIPPMWWSPSAGRSTTCTLWTAFATGDYARKLLAMDEADALQCGLDSLRRELDAPSLNFVEARLINWQDDPYSRGGYSVALPGGIGARAQLAQATPPLYWAGEATAHNGQAAMVHGAYLSGKRAAQEILAAARGGAA